MLAEAIRLGITPFLDLILTSPRSTLVDFAETIRQAYRWLLAGCEMGMYPYVIPFSGAPMARDPELAPHTLHERRRVGGTAIEWNQPSKIPPIDPRAREVILAVESRFTAMLDHLESMGLHLPSRVRSLIWINCAIPFLREAGFEAPDPDDALAQLVARLPELDAASRDRLRQFDAPVALLAVNQ